jgi:hypothetical protein
MLVRGATFHTSLDESPVVFYTVFTSPVERASRLLEGSWNHWRVPGKQHCEGKRFRKVSSVQ